MGKTLGFLLDENLTLERQVNSVKRQCGLIFKNLWHVNRLLGFPHQSVTGETVSDQPTRLLQHPVQWPSEETD